MVSTKFLPGIQCPEIIGTYRDFRALRNEGKREHAGIDFYTPIGTNVLFNLGEKFNGCVVRGYELFFRESYSMAVYSFLHNLTFRFCEVSKPLKKLKENDLVYPGTIIGHVADLDLNHAMLHLEVYEGMATRFGSNKNLVRRVTSLVSPWKYKHIFINE
jgi:hypothetical protein